MTQHLTLLDAGSAHELEAAVAADGVRIPPDAVHAALGWELKPEGLCRGEVCVPVRDREALVRDDGLDLATLAALLDRPLALDVEERCAALGEGHLSRADRLASLEAPDFELPDLAGRTHRLSDQRGKKVLLIAYASW